MLTFDLGGKYYLKQIRIAIHNFECALKNFKVSIKDNSDNWKCIGAYVCEPYSKEKEIQLFELGCITRFVKLDLIDNWGKGGGPYILVKKIMFSVGDLVD